MPIGHVAYPTVMAGAAAIAGALAREAAAGRRLVVIDAVSDADLAAIGRAARGRRLVTGGSGIALGLPANFAAPGGGAPEPPEWRGVAGPAAALAGSVSPATRRQIDAHRAAGQPSARARPPRRSSPAPPTRPSSPHWAASQSGVPLIHSTADPDAVAAAQALHGREALAEAFERTSRPPPARSPPAALRLVVGRRRDLRRGRHRPRHRGDGGRPGDRPRRPGARRPRTRSLALALKSGNFGADDFFAKAAARLGPAA